MGREAEGQLLAGVLREGGVSASEGDLVGGYLGAGEPVLVNVSKALEDRGLRAVLERRGLAEGDLVLARDIGLPDRVVDEAAEGEVGELGGHGLV